jgi:hypothetical protein
LIWKYYYWWSDVPHPAWYNTSFPFNLCELSWGQCWWWPQWPCPNNYKLPDITDWKNLVSIWNSIKDDVWWTFADQLNFPLAWYYEDNELKDKNKYWYYTSQWAYNPGSVWWLLVSSSQPVVKEAKGSNGAFSYTYWMQVRCFYD